MPDPTHAATRKPVAEALAALTLIGLVAAGGLGVSRYADAQAFRAAALTQLTADADQVAARFAQDGAEAVRGMAVGGADGEGEAYGELAAIWVAAAGATDAFGITRGAEIAVRRVDVDKAQPGDAATFDRELLNLAAEVESFVSEADDWRAVMPVDTRYALGAPDEDRVMLVSAVAPALDADGGYVGTVRVARAMRLPASAVPGWLVLLAALLAALAVFLGVRSAGPARLKPLAAGVGLVLTGGALVPGGVTLALSFAAVAAVIGYAFTSGLTELYRGVRNQPGTYLYVAPAVVSMVVLVFVPFGMGVGLSFFDTAGEFRGVANFHEILFPSETADTSFYWTLWITIAWTVVNVVLHVSIGLSLALVLNRPNLRFKGIYRVLLIVPWAVPNYITALIWKWMFNTHDGAVNAFLAIFGVDKIDWLGNSVLTNFTANVITNTWLGFPFMMVVSLGALQSIPKELYEASHIDGASRFQAFRHVTMPLLKPALIPAVILGTIWTFNMFNVIYLVSGGAPDNQTNILITEAYHAFKVLKRFGFAAAYSLLIFVILLAYGWMTNRVTKATEGAYE